MRFFHPQYHKLTRTHAPLVSIVIVCIMLAGFLLTFFAFNILLFQLKGQLQSLEEDTGATIRWQQISITLGPTVVVRDLYLYDGSGKRTLVAIPEARIRFAPHIFIKTLFTKFDAIPAHRRLDAQNKTLMFLLIKSIREFSVQDPIVRFDLKKDADVIRKLSALIQRQRIFPEHTLGQLINSTVQLKYSQSAIQMRAPSIEITLHQDQGLRFTYDADVRTKFLALSYETRLKGESHLFDIHRLRFEHAFSSSAISLNRHTSITPLLFDILHDKNDFQLNVWKEKSQLISLSGETKNDEFRLVTEKWVLPLTQLLIFSESSDFYDILSTEIYGELSYVSNVRTGKTAYSLQMRNRTSSDMVVDVSMHGTEKLLQFDSCMFRYQDQVLDLTGNIDLISLAPTGNATMRLQKPFVNFPVSALILFYPEQNYIVTEISQFIMRDVLQPKFKIVYNQHDFLLRIFEEKKTRPIISVRERLIMPERVFERKIGPNLIVSSYDVDFNRLDLAILDSLLFNNEQLKLFSSMLLSGTGIVHMQDGVFEGLSYAISFERGEDKLLQFTSQGSYSREEAVNISGDFVLQDILTGSFITEQISMGDSGIQEARMRLALDYVMSDFIATSMGSTIEAFSEEAEPIQDKLHRDEFLIVFDFNQDAQLRISIDESVLLQLDFRQNTLQTLLATFKSFTFAGFSNTINGTFEIGMEDGSIQSVDSDILISNPESKVFELQMTYKDNQGVIDSFHLYSQGTQFIGSGFAIYYPKSENFLFNITNSEELNKLYDTSQDNPFFYGIYNKKKRIFTLSFNNFSPAHVSKEVGGTTSGTMDVMLDFSQIELTLEPSEILLIRNNQRFIASGYFRYTADEFFVDDFVYVNDEFEIIADTISVRQNTLDMDLNIRSRLLTYKDILPQIRCRVNAVSNGASFYSSFAKPSEWDFLVSAVLIPFYDDGRFIPPLYTQNLTLNLKQDEFLVQEKNAKFFLSKNKIGKLFGRSRQVELPWDWQITGTANDDELALQFDFYSFNLSKIIQDFSLTEILPVQVNSGKFKGTFFVRGSFDEPKFYASINSNLISLTVPSLDKQFESQNFLVNVNENQISMSNISFKADDATLVMNGRGFFEKYRLEYVKLDFFTRGKDYFNFPEYRIGTLYISGEAQGLLSLEFDTNEVNVGGKMRVKDMVFYLDVENEETVSSNNSSFLFNANLTVTSDARVVFYWPQLSFPLLRSTIQKDQELEIRYDGLQNQAYITGKIDLQSGDIYYFNKAFNIRRGTILFDTENHAMPFIENFEANAVFRAHDKTYDLTLNTEGTFFDNIDFDISSSPPLSEHEINLLLGRNTRNDRMLVNDVLEDDPTLNIVGTFANLSSELSSIGFLSHFERVLANTLNLDYISFRTRIVENLINSALLSTAGSNEISKADTDLATLIDGTALEVGKYFDFAYFSLVFLARETEPLSNASVLYSSSLSLGAKLNVLFPTPILDVAWSFDPTLFNTRENVLLNTVTLSWHRKY